jgi:hypothetical protein
MDLNHRPSGYEPDELPDCSTPRRFASITHVLYLNQQILANLKLGSRICLLQPTSFQILRHNDKIYTIELSRIQYSYR